MHKNSKISISFIVVLASLVAATSPGIINLSVLAQSNGSDEDTSGSGDYEEFVNCLAQSEGDKGFASEDEIRDCFRPIYDPEAATNSIASDNGGNNDNDNGGNNLAPNAN